MITTAQAVQGIKRYVYNEVTPHLPTWKQLLVSGYIELAEGNLQNAVRKIKEYPAVSMLGIFNEQGDMDDARLYKVLNSLFADKKTIDIPIVGAFTFSQADVQRLFDLMRGA
jgi:hypothetical protein